MNLENFTQDKEKHCLFIYTSDITHYKIGLLCEHALFCGKKRLFYLNLTFSKLHLY